MYNRYIPQPDGSYRRNPTPDMSRTPTPQEPPPHQPEPEPVCAPPQQERPERPKQKNHQSGQSVMGFLKNLLPKGFDTADLLIVLLLLLMAGDSQDDQNYALLTLALYLFM